MAADNGRDPAPLADILAAIPRMALAFSGGLDSRFLACAARAAGCDVRLLHARGPHLAPADTAYACQWAKAQGFSLTVLDFNPLPLQEVNCNSRQRCYACKKALLGAAQRVMADFPGQWTLCDGTQADDLRVNRPGHRALAELGIVPPLARAGLGKARIRQEALALGMERPDQKARPCLLTRMAYGMAPDEETLQRVAKAEAELEPLLETIGDFRLRLAPHPVLQTAGPLGSLAPKADAILAENGFDNVQILTEGGISGFFDRT